MSYAKYPARGKNIKLLGKPLIINLGDSWTWGDGVEANETFSWFLQKNLKGCQILNAGECGAGLKKMYEVFECYKNNKNIKLVLLNILDIDMLRVGDYSRGDHFFDAIDSSKAIEYSLNYCKKIINFCRNNKIRIILSLFSHPFTSHHVRYDYLSKTLRKLADNSEVYYIGDMHDYFSLVNYSRFAVSSENDHPSVLIHKLIAKRLFEFIKENKILGVSAQFKNA